jgi:hypothetical protein
MWDELGIAPCDDPKAIRRAYAARLKTLDPDRDPQAFARLRHAFEQALSAAGRDPRPAAASQPPAAPEREADPAAEHSVTTEPEGDADSGASTAAPSAASPVDRTRTEHIAAEENFQSWIPSPDHDDIRDQALLIALDAVLRRREASEATTLFYRASATGALSLERGPDVIERLLAVAVDDKNLGAAAFRHLARTVGVDTKARTPIASALRQRVLARLAAEDWYEDLVAKAERKWRKGKAARRQTKIARLLLGRIGRHWQPRVDMAALKSWLAQYKPHAGWLGDRIDPAWIVKLEGRVRRREIFWLCCYTMLIGGLLIQFVSLSVIATFQGQVEGPLWLLMMGLFLVAFLLWIFKLLVTELLKLLLPRRSVWAHRGRAIWNRLIAK